ncbi:HD-GYP domain-containing protein [Amorphus orientalis]|uniref:Nucleotidyltransferase with HDIG domain n=1 Tax=Amorphus orientalis TaxID=649198 RepID=A0AAE3VKQ8_9HYPH|nr:HD domain-containing phosphohydrolase [Amorphus orientalis]MDQ0313939.1 putative nucleotidyltransferase with HDIG domain [Amorphus orientalis]
MADDGENPEWRHRVDPSAGGLIPGVGPATSEGDLEPLVSLRSDRAAERAEILLEALWHREPDTVDHLRRTAAVVEAVARKLGWPDPKVRRTRFAALLHDIGKIAISRDLMRKPGALTELEQEAMRQHVEFGDQILKAFAFPPSMRRIVREHHERVDGSGYPKGLRGDEICDGARLLTIVDIADAMLSLRPYKEAMSLDDVRAALWAGRGTLLDRDLVAPVLEEMGMGGPPKVQ